MSTIGSAVLGVLQPPTTLADNHWKESRFLGHVGGVNACSWGPAVASGSAISAENAGAPVAKRFVTAGNDNFIRIWR